VAGTGIANVTPSGNSHAVDSGSAFILTFTVSSGYENPQVTVGGSAVTPTQSNGTYTVTIAAVTANVTVSISASLIVIPTPIPSSKTITVVAGTGIANVTPSGNSHAVDSGSVFTLTFTVSSGYEKPQVTVGGSAVTPTQNGGTYTVTIAAVAANVTVSISATPVPTGIDDIDPNDFVVSVVYYSLYGREIQRPFMTGVYIIKETYASKKVVVTKKVIIVNDGRLNLE
jgi:hypothetical protein